MGHSPIITQHDSTMPDAKKAPKKAAAHPPFNKMIAAAIAGLKERGGSSRRAILKYVVANNKVDAKTAAVNVRLGLKRGLAKGTLFPRSRSPRRRRPLRRSRSPRRRRSRSPRQRRPPRSLQLKRPRSQPRRQPRNPPKRLSRSQPKRPPRRRQRSKQWLSPI